MLKRMFVAVSISLSFATGEAVAANDGKCYFLLPNGSQRTTPVDLWLPAFANVTFDPSVPDGKVLASQVVTARLDAGSNTSRVDCNSPTRINALIYGRVSDGSSSSTYFTWPTAMRGIGLRARLENNASWWTLRTSITSGATFVEIQPHRIILELVKTGKITGRGKIQGQFASLYINEFHFTVMNYHLGATEVRPNIPSCTVDVDSQKFNVPMGTMGITDVPLANPPLAGHGIPFKINLTCSGGVAGSTTRMYITLTDVTDPTNRSDILTLSADAQAAGVGIRIMNGSTPVRFGPDSDARNTQNQWFVTETGPGNVEIPLTAYYVRTGDNLKGGTANAMASFTMSYQ
jgi:type 1 fimbria pilin